MSTTTFTSDERLALLLNVLGEDVSNVAFQSMSGPRAIYIRQLLNEFRVDPPSPAEVEYVIGDFNQYFQFAMKALGPQIADAKGKKETAKPAEDTKKKTITYFEKVTPSDNPIADLNRLDAYQVAQAIGVDHPKTIALVLRNIDVKQAAKVLEQLSTDVRSETVIFLTHESTVPGPIVNQVLKTTVLKANSVESRTEIVDQSQVLADLMRSLPKPMRLQLLTSLEKADPELVQSIKSKLYLFEDVLRLEDREVQKLLGEIESDILILALQRCEQEMVDKLLNNLSKRARETIIEEMEFKKGISDEELETARTQLVAVLARLDESGDIKLK